MVNQTFFHTFAFYGSITNAVSNVQMNGVADSILTLNAGSQFIMPQNGKLLLAASGSANLQRVRLNTPALRYVGLPFLAPVNGALTVPSPPNVCNMFGIGPQLPKADSIVVEGTQGGGAAENGYCIMWVSFGSKIAPIGQRYRIRFTASITGATGLWANGTMSPDSTLPAGIYSVVGMDAQGTNLVAARLIFAGGGWRPGCLARNTLTGVPSEVFTQGDLGEYGTFDSINVPNLEIFVTGACTAQEVYLDLVRVGDR